MSAPTFSIALPIAPEARVGVTLALTLVADPDNPEIGDLHLDRGQLHFWSGQTAARQKITTRSRFFQGEWFLDTLEGIPYYQEIFGLKGIKKERVLSIFRQMLLSIPGVTKIIAIDLLVDTATRKGSVPYEVELSDGERLASEFTPFYFPGTKS